MEDIEIVGREADQTHTTAKNVTDAEGTNTIVPL